MKRLLLALALVLAMAGWGWGATATSGNWFASTNLTIAGGDKLYLLISTDGLSWSWYNSSPVYTAVAPDNSVRDPDIVKIGSTYYAAYNNCGNATNPSPTNGPVILSSPDLVTWTRIATPVIAEGYLVWAPRWFIDDDDSVHLFVSASPDTTHFQIYEIHPTNSNLTAWSAATVVTGVGLPTNMIDPFVLSKAQSTADPAAGKYNIWYKQHTTGNIEYMSSDSLLSGYTVTETGDWNGWRAISINLEGPTLIKVDATTWRLYFVTGSSSNWYYTESTTDWNDGSWSAPTALSYMTSQKMAWVHMKNDISWTRTNKYRPIASWNFENNLNDSFTTKNTLTGTAGIAYSNTEYKKDVYSLSVPAVTDRVYSTLATPTLTEGFPLFNSVQLKFTICGWFYGANSTQMVTFWIDSNGHDVFGFLRATNKLYYRYNNTNTDSTLALPATEWNFIAMVVDGDNGTVHTRVYRPSNSTWYTANQDSLGVLTATERPVTFSIGGRPGNTYGLQGYADFVNVFDRLLSDSEITLLMQGVIPGGGGITPSLGLSPGNRPPFLRRP